MFLPRTKRHSPIGIDAGARAVAAVQLVHTRSGRQIHAAASIPRTNSTEELSAGEMMRILGALRRQGFVGDRAVASVSPGLMFSAVLELPARASGAPLDVLARQELARSAKREPESIELAWWELPQGPGGGRTGCSALAIGCAHADATALLDCLDPAGAPRGAGLDVLALDAAPTALARACGPMLSAPPDLTAILWLSHDAAQVLILRGPVVVYERTLVEAGLRLLASGIANQIATAEGAGDLAEYIMRTYGCKAPAPDSSDELAASAADACALIGAHADALAAELGASMTYAARRFDASPTSVVLAGAGADIPGLAERLGERSGLRTTVARAGDLCPPGPGVDPATLGPGLTLALGLALYDQAPTPAMAKGGAA